MTREEVIQLALDIGLQAARNYKYRGSLEAMTEPERKELEQLLEFANKITQRDEALLRQALEALKKVAQSLEWYAHGRCRGFDDEAPLPTNEAVELAERTLAKVRFDLSPAQMEGAIREHLIRLGWTPPAR